ncbi:MAG: threonylcarbamoyl-AMP synthase, partial [Acidobacteria bacterium]|nr:threonylcarbamoyl-AMP synthase [Acidobacteriota bacterium]
MLRVSIDAAAPDPAVLRLAADLIARGGVIAFPTDTFYGLAVDPRRVEAVGALYLIKGRETGQPIALVAASQAQVDACVGRLPELGRRLARRFWPGPLTLVIAATPELAAALHSPSGCVAVRVPAHPIASALPALAGYALTATSANRSGEPAPRTADEVVVGLGGAIDLLLDAGPAPGGLPSTLVDVTGQAPVLVRAGAIPWERVLES